MDYMKKASEMIDVLAEKYMVISDKDISQVFFVKNYISEISAAVTKTEIFKDNNDRYEEFLSEIRNISESKERRILESWIHFIAKSAEAPTQLHLKGAVILCIPVINQMIKEYEEEI